MGWGQGLASFLKGVQQTDNNLGMALEQLEKRDQETLAQMLENEKVVAGVSALVEKSDQTIGDKVFDSAETFLGNHGITSDNYKDLAARQLAIGNLVEYYLKKHNLPKNDKQRKLAQNYLKTLSPEELALEFGVKTSPKQAKDKQENVPSKESNKQIDIDDAQASKPSLLGHLGADLKHLGKESINLAFDKPLSAQKYKNIGATLVNTPTRWGKMALNMLGGLDDLMEASRNKEGMTRVSPGFKEGIAPTIESLSNSQEKVRTSFGAEESYPGKGALEVGTDLWAPFPKAVKGGNVLARIAKNVAKGATAGAGYGALYSGGDPKAMKKAAILGGALHGLSGIKKPKNNNLYETIKSSADDISPKQASAKAAILGEEAVIPEIVGSESFINAIKKDSSHQNVERMRQMQANIKDAGKRSKDAVIQGEKSELYDNLGKVKDKVWNEKNKRYEVSKGEGLLDKQQLKQFYNAVQEAHAYNKGLPQFKPKKGNVNDKYLKEYKNSLESGVLKSKKEFRDWYIANERKLPTVDDFITYRSRINSALEKDPGNNALINLKESMDKIADSAKPNSYLKRANQYYAEHAAPFKDKKITEALEAQKFKHPNEAPPVSKIFGKDSTPSNARVFEKLSNADKKRVLGSMLDEIIKDSGMRPDRAIMKLWNDVLPDYIKKTPNRELQPILKDMQTLAGLDKTLTSLQQATTESIGSRQNVNTTTRILNKIGYAGSALGGVKGIAAYMGAKGIGKAWNKRKYDRFYKPLKQKHLKDYFNGELLEEIEQKKLKRIPLQALLTQGMNDEKSHKQRND